MIETIKEFKSAYNLAQRLVKYGADEEDAVSFVLEECFEDSNIENITDGLGVLFDTRATYYQTECDNPECRCEFGGRIELEINAGRFMVPVKCGFADWGRTDLDNRL